MGLETCVSPVTQGCSTPGRTTLGDATYTAPALAHPLSPHSTPPLCRQAAEAGDASFCVRVVTCGLTFTHREKFRSDLCMRYSRPIIVDAVFLRRYQDEREAARVLTQQVCGQGGWRLDGLQSPPGPLCCYASRAHRLILIAPTSVREPCPPHTPSPLSDLG